MDVLAYLIPVSLALGLIGLVAFVFTVRSGQYDDPEGSRHRVLDKSWDDKPPPD